MYINLLLGILINNNNYLKSKNYNISLNEIYNLSSEKLLKKIK